jgi:hypothetical protein
LYSDLRVAKASSPLEIPVSVDGKIASVMPSQYGLAVQRASNDIVTHYSDIAGKAVFGGV